MDHAHLSGCRLLWIRPCNSKASLALDPLFISEYQLQIAIADWLTFLYRRRVCNLKCLGNWKVFVRQCTRPLPLNSGLIENLNTHRVFGDLAWYDVYLLSWGFQSFAVCGKSLRGAHSDDEHMTLRRDNISTWTSTDKLVTYNYKSSQSGAVDRKNIGILSSITHCTMVFPPWQLCRHVVHASILMRVPGKTCEGWISSSNFGGTVGSGWSLLGYSF